MKRNSLLFLSFSVFTVVLLAFNSRKPATRLHNVSDTIPAFAMMARDHLGKSVINTNGSLSFTTGLHNDFYMVDSTNKKGHLYVETKIGTFFNDQARRVPLNICIVIDRSGSMSGVKMGFARKAAKGIVDQLKSEDIVSIVMYDNVVDSVQEPVQVIDKSAIHKKIDAISSRGGTNLWGGTEKGYEFVARNYKPGFINRVLLISDGLANVGLTDPKMIRMKVQQYKDDSGVTLSTFGVGLDYNETLMTDMAETGLGNYYFIDAPDQMAKLFDKEMNGLMNVAAQNTELRIKIPAGVRVEKAYPLKYTVEGDQLVFKLRDLFSEETKGALISFSIGDGTNNPLRFISTLNYTDVRDGSAKELINENILSPVQSVDAYLTHFNQQVMEQLILTRANENLELAMAAADRGDYDGSTRFVESNRAFLMSNKGYVSNSAELQRMDSINASYAVDMKRVRYMGADSVKRVQKRSKELNYNLRQKKQ